MKKLAILTLSNSVLILRFSVAFVFLTHSIYRIINWSMESFGQFMDSVGFPYGIVWVYGITAFEVIGGLLMMFGYFTRVISTGFIILLVAGIILIHASLGWFVGEHGTGGSEYSFILVASLLVIHASAAEAGRK